MTWICLQHNKISPDVAEKLRVAPYRTGNVRLFIIIHLKVNQSYTIGTSAYFQFDIGRSWKSIKSLKTQ